MVLPVVLAAFRLGRLDRTQLKRHFLKAVLGGATRAQIDTWSDRFVQQVLDHDVKPMAKTRIRHYREAGHRLVLASASFDFYVEQLGVRLGFDHVVSTRAAWTPANTLSGDLDGPNLKGQAKVAAVLKLLAEHYAFTPNSHERATKLTVYSDHHSDLPLMKIADTAVAVNPTRELAQVARRYHLAIEIW
jgi:HAD superfamily hydrolase (TIGR01490 family)